MNQATATVAVHVRATPDVTFDLFTRELDLWWGDQLTALREFASPS